MKLSNSHNNDERSLMLDYLSRLSEIVSESGDVESVYGGFKITVRDATHFPWTKVFNILTDLDHETWIVKKKSYLIIKTKPPSE